VVDAKVGEFVTSFDMAGASMTLLWLDDALEELWEMPCDTPAFRHGARLPRAVDAGRVIDEHPKAGSRGGREPVPAAGEGSRRATSFLAEAMRSIREAIDEQAEALGRMDAVAGDGDHGLGMQRGARAAAAAAEDARGDGSGIRTALMRSAEAWSNRGGGASGALWGVALQAAADKLSDEESPTAADIAAAVHAAARAVERSGKARVGDKTMVDALEPFAAAFGEAADGGHPVAEAWKNACEAAAEGAATTESMAARVGRARPHAEKSIGTPDPGAASFVIVVRAVLPVLTAGGTPHA
jgi:dihydroxyacetone kinase